MYIFFFGFFQVTILLFFFWPVFIHIYKKKMAEKKQIRVHRKTLNKSIKYVTFLFLFQFSLYKPGSYVTNMLKMVTKQFNIFCFF